jgi:hypothetical protein
LNPAISDLSQRTGKDLGVSHSYDGFEVSPCLEECWNKDEPRLGSAGDWSGLFDAFAKGLSINGQKIGTSHAIDFKNNFDGQGETTRASSMTAIPGKRSTNDRTLSSGN